MVRCRGTRYLGTGVRCRLNGRYCDRCVFCPLVKYVACSQLCKITVSCGMSRMADMLLIRCLFQDYEEWRWVDLLWTFFEVFLEVLLL